MSRVIQLLQPTDFCSFKGWVSQKNINPVFVASMRVPIKNGRAPRDVFCKIYPFTDNNRGFFNEIVGYLMAHACGVPQPSHAYIALMDVKDILDNNRDDYLSDELISLLQAEQYYPIFCTTKIDKSETAFNFHGWTPALVNEMSKWKYLPDTLAMDNIIAHTDRHLNNILRTGKQNYHVIDNGRLIRENDDCWQLADLDYNKDYQNKLWQFSEEHMPKSWKNIANNIMSICSEHSQAVQSCLDELNYWIKALYNGQQIDYNAFTDFLIKRANNSGFYHARRLNQLL